MARLLLIYEPNPEYFTIPENVLQATGKRTVSVDLGDSPNAGQAILASRMLAHLFMGLVTPPAPVPAGAPGDINSVTIGDVVFADAPVIPQIGQMIISRDVPYRWAKWSGNSWDLEEPYDQARPA